MNYGSRIIGTGSQFPQTTMHNKEFESFLETSDEWIRTRTGISERRIADPKLGENTLSLSLGAAQNALEKAGIRGSDLDLIVVGTVTPDSIMPTTANRLQAALGAKGFSFDLQAACAGFVYSLSVADHFIKAGTTKTALVIGAETLSTLVEWRDRSTAVLFGDGAGAVILQRTEDQEHRILGTHLHSDGQCGELLSIPHGYSRVPPWSPEYRLDHHKIKMKGSEVFKLAIRNMVEASTQLLTEHKVTAKEVDFFVFHQANMRIIEMCARALNVDKSQMWNNLERYGNTSAATLPSCLDEAWRAGAVKSGDLVLMATFGGGVTWASTLFRL
jgi:3-oxoacyl-[acyl-carrier-protein] synthase III